MDLSVRLDHSGLSDQCRQSDPSGLLLQQVLSGLQPCYQRQLHQ